MSMPFLEFSCDRCTFRGDSMVKWHKFRYERSPDGVPVGVALGWCNRCRGIVAREILPEPGRIDRMKSEIEAIKQRLAELQARANRKRSWVMKLLRENAPLPREGDVLSRDLMLAEFEFGNELARHRLLAGRQSRARCLRCGSEECLPLRMDLAPATSPRNATSPVPIGFQHPGCGGGILVRQSDIWASVERMERLYDRAGRESSGEAR